MLSGARRHELQSTRACADREDRAVGNHLPRRCGIATFTTDLSATLAASASVKECFVVAMNDAGNSRIYPDGVRFEIEEGGRVTLSFLLALVEMRSLDYARFSRTMGKRS
jgi:hypothetical protein